MQGWKRRLAKVGEPFLFDYPYMAAKKKRPDRPEVLEAAHRAAIAEALGRRRKVPLVLIGKSMGSRIGCHVADERVLCLVCFGYPLVGQNGKVRDEVLVGLARPILFLSGTLDPLCPLPLLSKVRKRMRVRNELYVVDEGDHSLEVRKSRLKEDGETQNDVDRRMLERIQEFVQSNMRDVRSDQRPRSPGRSW
jgi:predicted alpha/beta-hydrolase family hydrolase